MEERQENLYSIGEAAEILGISVQTLRYYDKIKLLEPAYTNPNTGYRYYSYIQLSLIDRIRYLQNFGLSLKDIKSAFTHDTGRALVPFLEKELQNKTQELQKMQETIDVLKWYINFFRYPDQQYFQGIPYKRVIGERYMLAVPTLPEEKNIRETSHPFPSSLRLRQIKADSAFKNVTFLRQNGYIIDFDGLMRREWTPRKYFIYLNGDPGFEHPNIVHIPAGEYLCFQGRPMINDWDTFYVQKIFETMPKNDWPTLVVADEYEQRLSNCFVALYEIQILIWPSEDDQQGNTFLVDTPGQIHRAQEKESET